MSWALPSIGKVWKMASYWSSLSPAPQPSSEPLEEAWELMASPEITPVVTPTIEISSEPESPEFQVAPAAIRELFVLQGRPDTDPAKWPAEAQLRAKLGGCFHAVLVAVRAVLAQTVRASSVVENLNSRMRDYFFLRDNIGPEYLDLLRFFLNHRRFPASEHPERQGKSPAEILSGKAHPHWLEMLGFPSLDALLGRAA